MSIVKKPWELGEIQDGTNNSPFSIPDFCIGEHLLVRQAPPKGKGVRDGLVSTFLMTSYFDAKDNKINLVEVKEGPNGYNITFPLGKRGLVSTKYRGPKSFFKWFDDGKPFTIPQDRYTVEYATQHLEKTQTAWASKSEVEKEESIDSYFEEMFLFAMSKDLALPVEGETFIQPVVGLKTTLYRVYTPPKEGERYGNIIITKWSQGKPSLEGAYTEIPTELAEAIHVEYQTKESAKNEFDPTKFVEDDDDEEII